MYVLRMPDEATQRDLLEVIVDKMPTWDVRQFYHVATNIVDNFALREQAGQVDIELAKKVRQFGEDLQRFLPKSKLDVVAAAADQVRGKQADSDATSSLAGTDEGYQALLKGLTPQPASKEEDFLGNSGLSSVGDDETMDMAPESGAGAPPGSRDHASGGGGRRSGRQEGDSKSKRLDLWA